MREIHESVLNASASSISRQSPRDDGAPKDSVVSVLSCAHFSGAAGLYVGVRFSDTSRA